MEIVRLPAGKVASEATDCIQIQEHADGGFSITGSFLEQDEDADSVSIGTVDRYSSADEAEAVGKGWAAEAGVSTLHVARSDGTAPLPDIFDLSDA